MKRTLNSGNARYHVVQNLLSSRLLSKYVKIIIGLLYTKLVGLYGCETWFLILRIGHKLMVPVFNNRMLRKIPEPKRDEVTGGRRKLHEELTRYY
jgi:hypothetical protein